MKITYSILGAVACICLGVAVGLLWRTPPSVDAPVPSLPPDVVACTMDARQCPDGSFVGRTGPSCEFVCPPLPAVSAEVAATIAAAADQVVITSPQPLSVVSSPLTITGKARGTWFFEGTFPVTLETASGTVLRSGIARATADAYTTDFVPFTAEFTWSDLSETDGILRVRRDNPSGLPENDRDLAIPIRFVPMLDS